MNFKYLFLLLFNLIFINACSSQETSDITLEGKWKVVDWTYKSFVGRSLDQDEINNMDESFADLILDFKTDQTFSSNKPTELDFLENKKFIVNNYQEVVINNQAYFFLIRDGNCYFFFSNIILQIKKIESYTNASIKLKELPADNTSVSEVFNKMEKFETVYAIEDLDIPPKFKEVQFDDNCLIDCLYNSFNSTIGIYIDYSKAEGDVSYYVNFIVDKSGEINNIKIKSKHHKTNANGQRFMSRMDEFDEKEHSELSAVEEDIVKSIFKFQNTMIAGVKNNQNVNTQLNLEVRLISK
ncbi:hypothetical protein AAG747_26490 [Rapidithrix thailandica]|uniref:Lipoprotein n=1 Tax=Rapidithrix thailandica TaxID=413964 RepID=A0AAW9SGP3_9BACT